MMRQILAGLVVLAVGAFTLLLLAAMQSLPPSSSVDLAAEVSRHLAESGVRHPVTAVLLNFRAYDTLLEVAVLLVALFGVFVVAQPAGGEPPPAFTDDVLGALARGLAPVMLVVAGYLLWAGAHRPGGAFQAAAIVAAAAVLLNLAQILPAWGLPRAWLRVGLAGGLVCFVVAAAPVYVPGTLLGFPPEWAGSMILAIETSLLISLGLLLAALFLCLALDREPQPQSPPLATEDR
ncbi:MAG: MnhB domain-containing protein [Gammaproteobacteria bacterium]